MNLFAHRPFLDVFASAYFPSKTYVVEDHLIDGKVFRLLNIGGRSSITTHPFLDMHEPLSGPVEDSPSTSVRWLPRVGHGMVPLEDFRDSPGLKGFSGAPTTLWRDFSTWDDYLVLLRQRRVLRDDERRRRRLEEVVGPLTFRVDDPGTDVLPTTFHWKSTQWRKTTGIDLFADPHNRFFFHELRHRGLLRASTLRAGNRLLAVWLGAVFEQRWYGWIFAYNPDKALEKYSVGRQLLYPMLEESYRAGHTEFDFSVGCEPYKLFFATHVRTIAPIGTPPVRFRLRRTLRDCVQNNPQVHERIKAVRQVLQRGLFRARCALVLRRPSGPHAPPAATMGQPAYRRRSIFSSHVSWFNSVVG